MHLRGNAFSLWRQQMGRFTNLRWRLTALLSLLLICILLVIWISVASLVQQTESRAWRGRQTEAALNMARAVTNLLESVENALGFLNLVGLDAIQPDKNFLEKVLRQYPVLQEIVYFNAQGELIAATSAATLYNQERSDLVQTAWFINAQSGRAYYGDLLIGEDAAPYLIAAIPAPNASVIAARVSMVALWRLVADPRAGRSGLTYIVDQRGHIIAHTDVQVVVSQKQFRERPAWFSLVKQRGVWYGEYINFDDQPVIGAIVSILGSEWLVVTELSKKDAFATSRRASWLLGGGLFAFMILLMWVSAEWLEGLILAPIERLHDGAERIGQGDLSYRIELVKHDEIGQVALAFNQMATELAELYNSLEHKIAERTQQLEEQAVELARSNRELAQFAYVASHDLQEPLRMITSYVQLLEQRYHGQLDQDAQTFIAFAVDGATRMQQLIRDLLAYSRVGTHSQTLHPVDSRLILQQVLSNLQMAIQESSAQISYGELPTVLADPTQLGQLFQNLLANAIKFRSTRLPQISIRAYYAPEAKEWRFAIEDNGIGIPTEDFDRIFLIFQRLHTRHAYPGTGIGLALCKKILERHNGRLWVESVVGQGTTFYFSLPEQR